MKSIDRLIIRRNAAEEALANLANRPDERTAHAHARGYILGLNDAIAVMSEEQVRT